VSNALATFLLLRDKKGLEIGYETANLLWGRGVASCQREDVGNFLKTLAHPEKACRTCLL
jgi:hypothetical protein